jgi:hypothetical protein
LNPYLNGMRAVESLAAASLASASFLAATSLGVFAGLVNSFGLLLPPTCLALVEIAPGSDFFLTAILGSAFKSYCFSAFGYKAADRECAVFSTHGFLAAITLVAAGLLVSTFSLAPLLVAAGFLLVRDFLSIAIVVLQCEISLLYAELLQASCQSLLHPLGAEGSA